MSRVRVDFSFNQLGRKGFVENSFDEFQVLTVTYVHILYVYRSKRIC